MALTWVLLGASIILFLIGISTKSIDADVIVAAFKLFLVNAIVALTLASIQKCQNCGRRFLVEHPGVKHSNAVKFGKMDYWSSAVIDILKNGEFTCMYCGVRFALEKRKRQRL